MLVADPTQENAEAEVDLGVDNVAHVGPEQVDELLLDEWQLRQELVLLGRVDRVRQAPQTECPRERLELAVRKDVCRDLRRDASCNDTSVRSHTDKPHGRQRTDEVDEALLVRRHQGLDQRPPVAIARRRSVEKAVVCECVAHRSLPRSHGAGNLGHLGQEREHRRVNVQRPASAVSYSKSVKSQRAHLARDLKAGLTR